MNPSSLLIGLDGGATKIRGAIVTISKDGIAEDDIEPKEIIYREIPSFMPQFQPVVLATQLQQFQSNSMALTPDEIVQGQAFVEAAAWVVEKLLSAANAKHIPVVLGIGMPGLKTTDRRGIAVMSNGPRIPNYCQWLEQRLSQLGISLAALIAALGSDADYCGIGEDHSQHGALQGINNAYYLGVGTGIADAMKLQGKLVPLDQAKPWMAKSWEILAHSNITMEKVISMPGIWQNYCQQVACGDGQKLAAQLQSDGHAGMVFNQALEGDVISQKIIAQVAEDLAKLIYDRIATLAVGGTTLGFANPQRSVTTSHAWLGQCWQRIVIGQRLGYFWQQPQYRSIFQDLVLDKLQALLQKLPKNIQDEYQKDWPNWIVASQRDHAPILGAALAAWESQQT